MKHHLPRCSLPTKHDRVNLAQIQLPEPKLSNPCVLCGERSVYCVHKRPNNAFVCENCYRKQYTHPIAKQKQWIWDHKSSIGCVLCSERDPRCLDYHHLHPKKKKFSIGSIPSSIPSHAIQIEMKKCVVVCANCHRQIEIMARCK